MPRNIPILVVLLFVFSLPNQLWAFSCPFPPEGTPPLSLISSRLETVRFKQDEVEKRLVEVESGIQGLLEKESEMMRLMEEGAILDNEMILLFIIEGRRIEEEMKKLMGGKLAMENFLTVLRESRKSLEEEMDSVGLSREIALCEAAELEQLLSKDLIEFGSVQCTPEVSKINEIAKILSVLKGDLIKESESDLAKIAIANFSHRAPRLVNQLFREEFKLVWPQRLEQLEQAILRVGNLSPALYEKFIGEGKLLDLISDQMAFFRQLEGENWCSEVGKAATAFYESFKSQFSDPVAFAHLDTTFLADMNFVEMNSLAVMLLEMGAVLQSYSLVDLNDPTILSDETLPDEFRSLVNLSVGPGARGIVLYVHWQNDPYEAAISDRATVDRETRSAEESFRELSFGQFSIGFDVCEAYADSTRPSISSGLIIPTMIRLCEDQVNFANYDWLLLYPTAAGNGRYLGRHEWPTDDGLVALHTITMGRNHFDDETILHEGGHVLGLNHAHDLDCGESVFGGSCLERSDYGDPFDTMAAYPGHGHFNCAYKEKLGWLEMEAGLSSALPDLLGAVEAGSTDPQCIQLEVDNALTSGVVHDYRAERFVTEPCDTLSVEYREPLGYDRMIIMDAILSADQSRLENLYSFDFATIGVLFLRCTTDENGRHTYLLDCSPNSREDWRDDLFDGFILPGETCTTGLGWQVRFVGPSTSSERVAVVQIDLGEPDCVYAPEICDNTDNDCNGRVDEGCDDDRDNYCDLNMAMVSDGILSICSFGGGDCDDNRASTNPGIELERLDGRDDNCNEEIDEGITFSCDDSDGGMMPGIGGSVTLTVHDSLDQSFIYADSCHSRLSYGRTIYSVQEYICDPTRAGRIDSSDIDCLPTETCIDPDGNSGPIPGYCGLSE